MNYGITLKVSGDYALFSRPEMKVERVSYDVMTPSAARGVLEAIYWKPQIRWIIDEIHVLNPIRFTNIRRNEISSKIAIKGGSGVNAAMLNPEMHLSMD
ncbi:MAG: type I-C CRISPR-associated protein Cas5c, partial [Akkermansiaceae bacterium]|nr:type I-C CRISPR-associated protein Cas5c [Akkermansiaceae bacterium]